MKKGFKNWFTEKGLQVLPYQQEILEEKLELVYTSNKPVVLGACPAAGKTTMAIYFIEQYLQRNPMAKILVLCHGTKIIKTQFFGVLKELKPSFYYFSLDTCADVMKASVPVQLALPQAIKDCKDLPEIDLLIVDEAHQFYFAEMVQGIISRIKPKHQLLLTGTPSEFIQKGYPVISIAVEEVMSQGMIDDITIKLFSTDCNLQFNDYNKDDEVKNTFHIPKEVTINTLKRLIERGDITNDEKILIACKNVEQAKEVEYYLDSCGIATAMSVAETDKDSNEIGRFKDDKECRALIVVYRGILGFNMPELTTVIDLTLSQNINRIFQLLSRATRNHPSGKSKKFIKVTPQNLHDYFEYVMTAVLLLTNKDYYEKYNGINFNGLLIPIRKSENDKKNNGGTYDKAEEFKLRKLNYEGLPAIQFFKTFLAIPDNYSTVQLAEIKQAFSGKREMNKWTKEECIDEAKNYKTITEWSKNSKGCYAKAWREKWLDECTVHMAIPYKKFAKWTADKLYKEAEKYNDKAEWRKNSPSSFSAAHQKKILNQCLAHTKQYSSMCMKECINIAKNFISVEGWLEYNPIVYYVALNNRWLEQCCEHMREFSVEKVFNQ